MATIANELHFNNGDYVSIKVINVSVFIHPQVEVVLDDDTEKKEMSMEEKRRLFYKQRLEQITNVFS